MVSLYRCESSDPKYDAQRNLCGRTHYVDDDTLRYFHARILSVHVIDGGLLYAVLESASGDFNRTTRIYRYVVFDLFGNVVDRPDIDSSWKSTEPARKAMWKALERIDAIAVNREAMERHRAAFDREMVDLDKKLTEAGDKVAA